MLQQLSEESTDEQLIQGIQQSDEVAIEIFFRRYQDLVFSLCLRVVANRREAEDVMMEIFWEIWKSAGKYDLSRGTPRTYLMLLTRSRAIDRKRKNTRRIDHELGFFPSDLSSWEDGKTGYSDPAQLAQLSENRGTVVNAMSQLNERQQKVVQLSFFDGLTHTEISERLELPLGSVKSSIRQGLIKLKGILAEHFLD